MIRSGVPTSLWPVRVLRKNTTAFIVSDLPDCVLSKPPMAGNFCEKGLRAHVST